MTFGGSSQDEPGFDAEEQDDDEIDAAGAYYETDMVVAGYVNIEEKILHA